KTITLFTLVTITIAILLSSVFAQSEDAKREKLLAQIIHSGLDRWHYSDVKINDEFSEKAFDVFLDFFDFSKQFLLKEDVKELRKYSDKIDDQFVIGSTELMDTATQLLEKRIRQVQEFLPQLLARPFDFNKEENYELDAEKRVYSANIDQLKEHWRKLLKQRTLTRYIGLLEAEKNKKNKGKTINKANKAKITAKVNPELEEKARNLVLKAFKPYFNRQLQAAKTEALSRYLNSVVQVFDPHTLYFAPSDKEDFDMQMSGSFEGIGALLNQDGEYVKVSKIVPGGPSWHQKQLQAGDLILKVGQEDLEPVDIIGMRVRDAVKLIRGKKNTVVRLTVKKPDGQNTVIPIVRDVVILEDTFARSAVLAHKKVGKRFGYIFLPAFYNDFSKSDGRSSSEDVKKELEALKKKNVDGIILDLRRNTGGALKDAIKMSGLFFPEGPVVQVKDNRSQVMVLDDPDSSVTYSGPLVVLVDIISASASEILAAALQDYNRAVIVGGAHSYGKGTVQWVINLDRFLAQSSPDRKPFGALAITIQKYYRIDGTSIQLKGVVPDIVLPDRFDYFDIGEKHLDNYLRWDTVPTASFEKWTPQSPVTNELVQRSKARVEKDSHFKLIEEYGKRVKRIRSETLQSLQLEKVLSRREKLNAENKRLTDANEKIDLVHLDVLPSRAPEKKQSVQLDKIALERQQQWFKDIKKDIVLGEAVEILNDMSTRQ
ncbi:MAG: tail-specific protease, partial [bacterium]|nr:tail-specific protease [bacterium]